MAERKHTPGPWVVLGDDLKEGDIPFIEVCAGQMPGPSYKLIAEVQCADNGSEDISKAFVLTDENWANAHLIAEAPDMLEALRALIRDACPCNWSDDELTARAWLEAERLTGEPLPDEDYNGHRRAGLASVKEGA